MPEPVIVADCAEPGGVVTRSVYPLHLTPENMKKFWEKARQFKNLFDEEVRGDFKKFCSLLLHEGKDGLASNGLFWVVDDFVGVFYMTKIQPGKDAEVHYTFFDRRQNGRVNLTREMLKYVFQKYAFRRLSVEIPLFASAQTFHFIVALGFRVEGVKRKAAWYNDAWFDVKLFGLLRENILDTAYVRQEVTSGSTN